MSELNIIRTNRSLIDLQINPQDATEGSSIIVDDLEGLVIGDSFIVKSDYQSAALPFPGYELATITGIAICKASEMTEILIKRVSRDYTLSKDKDDIFFMIDFESKHRFFDTEVLKEPSASQFMLLHPNKSDPNDKVEDGIISKIEAEKEAKWTAEWAQHRKAFFELESKPEQLRLPFTDSETIT